MSSVPVTPADEEAVDELEGTSRNFTQLLKLAVKAETRQMRVGMPGQVDRVTRLKTKGCVDVVPCIRDRYADGTTQPMPVLTNVPVLMKSGGGFAEYWPLVKGDYVWLVFGERSLDEWKAQGGQGQTAADRRRFHLSDAVAIVGPRPFNDPRLLTSDGYAVGLEDDTQKLEILDDRVAITTTTEIRLGSDSPSLNGVADGSKADRILRALDDALTNWTVAPTDGGAALKTYYTTTAAPAEGYVAGSPPSTESSKVKAE